jgi:Sortilin, neurotensin receptor 3,
MEPFFAYVGTERGLRTVHITDDGLTEVGSCVHGNVVRDLAVDPSDPDTAYIACGYRGWGLHRTRDRGRSAEPIAFADRWVWGVALHPLDPATMFVGTEPPAVHVSRDSANSFEAYTGIDRLPSRSAWTFFYEPFNAGHVHGFGLHPLRPDRILAGVEVGGFIGSDDSGLTWREALVGHDVHLIVVDPSAPDRVLAATGEGLFVSRDAGRTWNGVPVLAAYMHQIAFDPSTANRVYACVDADGFAPLYRSEDSGENWMPVTANLPQPGASVPLAFHPTDPDVLIYGGNVSDTVGRVFTSEDRGQTWRQLVGDLPRVWRLKALRLDETMSG